MNFYSCLSRPCIYENRERSFTRVKSMGSQLSPVHAQELTWRLLFGLDA